MSASSISSIAIARPSRHPTPRELAERIYRKVHAAGGRQVRLWRGMLLTYPTRVRRGYGTRGELVGVYDITAHLEWIEADVKQALGDS